MAVWIARPSAPRACAALVTLLLAGCAARPPAGATSPEARASEGTTSAGDPSALEHPASAKTASAGAAQVQRGAELFVANCSPCHGPSGGGSEIAPPLVGAGALPANPRPTQSLRTTQFRTAKDVYQFISTYMPRSSPGALPPDQYYAILAFLLKANGMRTSESALDARNVASTGLR